MNIYPKHQGIIVDYISYLMYDKKLETTTVYSYNLTLTRLMQFLVKARYNLECDVQEVELGAISYADVSSISEQEWFRFLDYCEYINRESIKKIYNRATVIRCFYKWVAATYNWTVPAFILAPPIKHPEVKAAQETISETVENHFCELLLEDGGENAVRNVCIVRMAMRCGLGVEELCALDLENIEVNGVSSKGRTIPFDDVTKESVNHYLDVREPPKDGSNAFFTTGDGHRLKRPSIQKMFLKAQRRLNPNAMFTFGDMQRTARCRIAKAGNENRMSISNIRSPYYYNKRYLQDCTPTKN